ncbi:MAG: TIGR02206 family membrane protein [Spirochaetes bacterium]|nr:TIGR02206 family membrane protein [Spirochaetota bacterium]
MNSSIFNLFSCEHIAALIILFIINIITILFLKRAVNERINRIFRINLGILIILLEIAGNLWKILHGKWSLNTSLPLHLCGISAYICAVILIMKNRSFIELAYFWSLGGAMIALITPNLEFTFPHFMFLKFFLTHNALVLSVMYFIFIEDFRPSLKSVWKALIITNIYAIIVAPINHVLKSNYLYICHKPGGSTLLDCMGSWPYNIFAMEIAAIIIFFLLYLPFDINDYRKYFKGLRH